MSPRAAGVRNGFSAVLRALCVAAASALFVVFATGPAEAQDAKADEAARIAEATKEYERRLGMPLRVARRGPFVVRGDNEQADLENLAELCRATLENFTGAVGCSEAEALPAPAKGESARVEVFQFVREKGYLDFIDKVLARIRDDTVDDRRVALMRRQRGFFVLSPRPLLVQYQGPSDLATVRAQCVHKTSHMLLLSHRKAGAWMPWWFLEGFGTWQEMRVLQESRVYCIEVERPGDYARPGTPEADEAAKARLESYWRRRAKELVDQRRAKDLTRLAKLSLNELALDDVVQSWSVVDWLHRERKLGEFVRAYKEKREFAATCEAALGAPPPAVEARWAAAAALGR